MTITVNETRNEYTATAGQTVFSYTFKIFADTDLNVYQTLAGATADDTTDIITGYAVTGVGDSAGGTIVLNSGAAVGDLITIVSDIPETRTTDYQSNGDFIPDTVNNDFDRVVSLVKQAVGLSERSLHFQESEQGASSLSLPSAEALQILRWKSDESGLENIDSSLGLPTDSDLVSFGQSGTGAATVTVESKLQESVSLTDFGAVGDGATDDYTALSNAVAFCLLTGRELFVPCGQYLIDTDGGSISLKNIRIRGESAIDMTTLDKPADLTGATPDSGAVFFITGTANSVFAVYQGGISINNVGFFYPNQSSIGSPTVYPTIFEATYPDPSNIKNSIEFFEIKDCVFYNPYKIFNHGTNTYSLGNFRFLDNRVCCLNRAINVAKHSDIIEIKNNTFSPSVYDEITASDAAKGDMMDNAEVIQINSGEGLIFQSNFVFQHSKAIICVGGVTDRENLFLITGNIFDQVPITIQATATGAFVNGSISDNVFLSKNQIDVDAGTYDTNVASISLVSTTTTGNDIAIAGNIFSTTTGSHIKVTGSSPDRFAITGNVFNEWAQGQTAGNVQSIHLDNASAKMVCNGNKFQGLSLTATSRSIFVQACVNAIINGNNIDRGTNGIQVNSSVDLIVNGNITTNSSGVPINITAPTGTLVNTDNIAS